MIQKPTYESLEKWVNSLERENQSLLESYRKIEASEKLYRITLENISDTVLITNDNGKIIYVCPNTNIIFGFSQSEVYRLGSVYELLKANVCDVFELKRKKEITNIEWSIKDKFGHEHCLLINIKSVEINDGTILYVMHDITDRKVTQEEIEKNRRILAEAEKLAGLGGWEWDITNDVWTLSENWLLIHGCSDPHLKTAELMYIAHPEDRPKIEKAFIRSATHGEPYKIEHRIIKQDTGEIRYIQAFGDVRLDSSGKATNMFGAALDITDRKIAEEERESLRLQLIQSQKMEAIGTLAGGIAHDFNNLLMGIQGRTSLMAIKENLSPYQQEQINAIEECVSSAANLTRQLLGFARIGKYEVKPIDINELVRKNITMFGRTRKYIRTHTKLCPQPLVVDGDKQQIGQVLLNIFVNACQAMPNGGDLIIATDNVELGEATCSPHQLPPGSYVNLTITDTGIGMSQSTLERIFDPFFTTKEKGRGTGLGLASAYGIVKNHEGFISVLSEIGNGTTFDIYFPLSDKSVIKESNLIEEIFTGSETILLVDDQQMIIDVGKGMLEQLGYSVVVAKSGEKAVEKISDRGAEIDLVILDLIMPGMGGAKAFDRIREIKPMIPVILSSGYSIDGQASEIMQRGCNDFIQKPFSIQTLSQTIRKVLDEYKG
jgi:PAS domain S-box-containing protein